jgi:hypothetical protein
MVKIKSASENVKPKLESRRALGLQSRLLAMNLDYTHWFSCSAKSNHWTYASSSSQLLKEHTGEGARASENIETGSGTTT